MRARRAIAGAAVAIAMAVVACSSFNGEPQETSTPEAGVPDAAPARTVDAAAVDADASGSAEASTTDAGADASTCAVDCSGSYAQCDGFDRASPVGGTIWQAKQSTAGTPGDVFDLGPAEPGSCGTFYDVRVAETGNYTDDEYLFTSVGHALDKIDVEMDIWLDDGSYAGGLAQGQTRLLAFGDPAQLDNPVGDSAALVVNQKGLEIVLRDLGGVPVEQPVALARQAWVHIRWSVVFSNDASLGRVSFFVGDHSEYEVTKATAGRPTPIDSYVIQLGARSQLSSPTVTVKYDNVKITQ